jgi:hypothetical protein
VGRQRGNRRSGLVDKAEVVVEEWQSLVEKKGRKKKEELHGPEVGWKFPALSIFWRGYRSPSRMTQMYR